MEQPLYKIHSNDRRGRLVAVARYRSVNGPPRLRAKIFPPLLRKLYGEFTCRDATACTGHIGEPFGAKCAGAFL